MRGTVGLLIWLFCLFQLEIGQGKLPSACGPNASDKLRYLRAKVEEMDNVPVFEFGEVVGSLIDDLDGNEEEDEVVSDFDVDILFAVYTERLCSLYCRRFLQQLGGQAPGEDISPETLNLLKSDAMMECEKAMRSGRPSSRVDAWDIKPALRDLELDIDKLIKQIDLDVNEEKEEIGEHIDVSINGEEKSTSLIRKILRPKIRVPGSEFVTNFFGSKPRKRLKWVFMQSLVLLFNFAQNEITRRTAVRNIEKKLAEVPEFPMM